MALRVEPSFASSRRTGGGASASVRGAEGPKASPSDGAPVRVGLATQLLYGVGSIAFGVKDNGFQTILLIFYNQVVGLPAALVGLAILIALASDAIMDPIIGQISDNLRTPWGRRHPLMYAAALPLGLSYLMLWNPPHAGVGVQFAYLIIVSIVVRTLISLYEAPSAALAPELTTEYAERTSMMGYRVFFAWFGGLAVYILALTVFLKPDAAHKVGQLNPVGYAHYGLFAGCLMTLTILISSLGTHGRIKTFAQPSRRPLKAALLVREAMSSLANASFLTLLVTALLSAAGSGLSFSMSLYLSTYFWRLSADQIAVLAFASLASAALAMVIAKMASGLEKKAATIAISIGGLALACTPIVLRLFSLFPPNGSALLFPLLIVFTVLGLAGMIAGSMLVMSMVADVVEDSQLRTGRRSEGLFFASASFVMKAVSGFGVLLSGLILTLVHFPAHAKAGAVDPAVLNHLALLYVPIIIGLFLASALFLMPYRITRRVHEANLKKLAEADAQAPNLLGVR
jgi:Na+/melibiose symporter-like transporter